MKKWFTASGKGFSTLEVLMVMAIVAMLAGVAVPLYLQYSIRSDLRIAAEQAKQALRRAQLLSQTGFADQQWGYRSDASTLFAGKTFASRDPEQDQVYPLPVNISVSGLSEVVFSRIYGVPSAVGDIVFTASNGDQLTVPVRAETTLSGPPVPPVRFRVHFDRLKNNGNGSAEKKVFVGENATLYEEDTWIPVSDNGVAIIDQGIDLNVTGLSVQRQNGFVRIVAYGGLDNGGKEVVDATIEFDHGSIDHIANEEGENEGEQPFDGNVNEGVGGDEYSLAADKKSVQFKSRVTNAGDTILIFWQE